MAVGFGASSVNNRRNLRLKVEDPKEDNDKWSVKVTATLVEDGVGIPNVELRFFLDGTEVNKDDTDGDGELEYTFKDVPEGKHKFMVRTGNLKKESEKKVGEGGGGSKGAFAVELKAVKLPNNGGYHIHGTVVNDKGAGVKKSKIKIMSDEDGVLESSLDAPEGSFSTEVNPKGTEVTYRFIVLDTNVDGTLRLLNTNAAFHSKAWARICSVAMLLFMITFAVTVTKTLTTGNETPAPEKPWYENTQKFDRETQSTDTGSTIPPGVKSLWKVSGVLFLISFVTLLGATKGIPSHVYYWIRERKETDYKVKEKSGEVKTTNSSVGSWFSNFLSFAWKDIGMDVLQGGVKNAVKTVIGKKP